MERLTTDKPVSEMGMVGLAYFRSNGKQHKKRTKQTDDKL